MRHKSNELSLLGHLEELRKRLIICAITMLGSTVIGFTFVDTLQQWLLRPAGHLELIFVSPPEALMASFRLAIITGLILSLPLILYQLLAFVMPALYKEEKRVLIPAVLIMVFFFALGSAFAYFTVFPFTIRFFMNFSTTTVKPMFTISNYLSFATSFIFAFGVVFQTPVIFYILGRLGVIDAPFLRKYRKYALLIVMLLSAVLTPPDVISQLMMAGPLMILYEVGTLLVAVSRRNDNKEVAGQS